MSKNKSELESIISKRRSVRQFETSSISSITVSRLLWAGQGADQSNQFRNSPSAGGQFPIRLDLAVNRVDNMEQGIYLFDPGNDFFSSGSEGAISAMIEQAVIGEQPWVENAALVVLVSAALDAMNLHFQDQLPAGKRGQRYAYIEAGAVLQNMSLMATTLGLGSVIVGGFDDDKVASLFHLEEDFAPVALLCVGNPIDN